MYFPPSTDITTYFKSGLHLWRSVIYRAMQEAQGEMLAITASHGVEDRRQQLQQLQREAIEWLVNDSDDLHAVWEMADIPMLYSEFIASNKERFGDGGE